VRTDGGRDDPDVAPDGSPVAVYLAMPPHDALELVADQVPAGGSVLDLGCGVGRLADPLATLGLSVVGVDAHADLVGLDLGRRFDVVVLASHLVNHPSRAPAFLTTCRRHVATDGCVLVERFHPDLLDELDEREGTVDAVHVRHEVHRRDGTAFTASAHYSVGGRTWTQRYDAVLLDDAALDRLLARAGLRAEAWLDEDDRWLRAVPVPVPAAPAG
jgi:SAM-dependent methyltransferase